MRLNRESASFYQFAACSVCKSDEKLMVHKYTDDLMCQVCVGELIEKENEKKICNFCAGSGEGYYNNETNCIHCNGRGVL